MCFQYRHQGRYQTHQYKIRVNESCPICGRFYSTLCGKLAWWTPTDLAGRHLWCGRLCFNCYLNTREIVYQWKRLKKKEILLHWSISTATTTIRKLKLKQKMESGLTCLWNGGLHRIPDILSYKSVDFSRLPLKILSAEKQLLRVRDKLGSSYQNLFESLSSNYLRRDWRRNQEPSKESISNHLNWVSKTSRRKFRPKFLRHFLFAYRGISSLSELQDCPNCSNLMLSVNGDECHFCGHFNHYQCPCWICTEKRSIDGKVREENIKFWDEKAKEYLGVK